MSTKFLKNGNKVHIYMNTILKKHTISNSAGAPITRSNVQHSKASYSRLPQTKVKQMECSVPLPSNNVNGVTRFSAISNSRIIGWYLNMLKSRPVLTSTVTTTLIYTAADLSSQTITRSSSEPYDLVRTLRMAGFGMIILGPSLRFWFNFMSRLFPYRDLISTFKKMSMGQVIYTPMLIVVFFSLNAVLQGESGSEIVARLKRDLIPSLINGLMYWCVCDSIMYRFIPLHLQPLVNNLFLYIWKVYMTYMANLEKADTK